MEAGTTATNLTAKLPILNPEEYDLWLIRIEQYFLMTDYFLWEVIKNASSSKTLDQTFDRLQKLISQVEIQDEVIEQEDINLKVIKHKSKSIKCGVVSSNSTHNTSITNEADNTTYGVSTAHTQEKINVLNLEVKLRDNALVVYTKNLEKAKKERDELKLTLEKYQNSSKSLDTLLECQLSDKDKTRLRYKVASPTIENFMNSSKMIENQENVRSISDKGYHVVPPPYTGNYIPPKSNLMFIDEQVESEFVNVVSTVSSSAVKTVESKVESVDVKNKGVCSTIETKPVKKNSFSPPIIEDWIFDDESEVEFKPKVKDKNVRPSIEKIKFVKTAREIKENVETPKQQKHYPRGNQRNGNNLMSQMLGSNFKMLNKACYVCGSFEHLHYVCDQRVVKDQCVTTQEG
nr:retrotransposon Orf1 [Tanacetum cinerariifolium]